VETVGSASEGRIPGVKTGPDIVPTSSRDIDAEFTSEVYRIRGTRISITEETIKLAAETGFVALSIWFGAEAATALNLNQFPEGARSAIEHGAPPLAGITLTKLWAILIEKRIEQRRPFGNEASPIASELHLELKKQENRMTELGGNAHRHFGRLIEKADGDEPNRAPYGGLARILMPDHQASSYLWVCPQCRADHPTKAPADAHKS
jgi:hypothetical protein